MVSIVNTMISTEGISLAHAAAAVNMPVSSLSRWRNDISSDVIESQKAKKSSHQCPTGFLEDIKVDLINFIDKWRDRGFPVSRLSVVKKAGQLKPEFEEKSMEARFMCVSRFLQQNGLVHRLATHTAQRAPDDVELDAKSYMDLVVPKLVGRTRDPKFTMNMDQTNVYYRQTAKTTINRRGARTVNMRAGANDSKRCTAAFTVTASGCFLPPFVVYQGTRDKGGYNSQA